MRSVWLLAVTGYMLGWSVAWPPGPINAEALRRALARNGWAAYAVVLGGCAGDALWALLVATGAARLRQTQVAHVLAHVSTVLLVLLGAVFLYAAFHRWKDRKVASAAATPIHAARSGFAVGLLLALTSPWNLAFWTGVMGHRAVGGGDLASAMIIGAGVVAGAATWGAILCFGAARFARTFTSPLWDVATRAVTGVVMLIFALETALRT